MTYKHLFKLVTAAALLIITSTGYSQNVGIGQSAPASKVDVKGNLTVGAGYSGTAAPANGAIIQGNVGIGTTTPAQTLEIGATTGTIRIDGMKSGNSFNTSATSVSNLIFVNNSTGDLSALSNGGTGQVLSLNGSGVPTWSTITAATVSGWALTGNAASTAGTNFIGTTNGTDLIFESNDAENMRLSSSTGNVVIGSGEGGSAVGNVIRAPYNNSGGNKTGADFTIAAGAPTGKAGSGNIIFQELAPNVGSPGNISDLSIMAEVMRITNTGALSFGSTGIAIGNANNVLISGGSSTNPSWGQLPLNDAVNAVTGTLAAGNGGTGQSTYTVGDMLYASSASLLNKTNAAAAGEVLIGNGTIPTFTTLSGDIGTITSAGVVTVTGIEGKAISATAPTTGQLLEYNGTNWIPTTQTITLSGDVSGSGTTAITTTLATVNSNVGTFGSATSVGQFTVNAKGLITSASNVTITGVTPGGTAGGDLSGTYPDPSVAGILGKTISPTTLASTDILEYNGTNWVPTTFPTSLAPSGTAGGDLSGTYPNPTVAKINGVALGTTTATTGNLLIANGTNWVTEAMSGDASITSLGAVTVKGILGKTISPTTLASTDILEYNGTNWVPTLFPTSLAPSGTAGGDLSGTYPNPTVAKINGVALGTTTATTGNLLIANGTNWVTEPMSGEATITSSGAVTVTGIQGKAISSTAPTTTQVLEYNGTSWVPTALPTSLAPSGTAGGDLSGTYPNPTVAAINGVALGTTTATTGNLLIANGTNWVTKAMSGDATISSAGAVTVAGILGKTISPTTLASTDILEYNGTNWVPTAFPTSLAPSGTAGGDLSGTYPNPTVAKINGVALGTTTATTGNLLIANGTNWVTEAMSGDASITSAGVVTVKALQGKTISSTAPTTGQVLEYNGTNWTPTTISSSGSSQWTTSGTNIYNNNTGDVGVGTNSPNTQLDINGDLALRDTAISSTSSTLTPNGFSFVKLTSSSGFTLKTISGGVNGKVLIIYDVNGNMKIASGGNIIGWDTYGTTGTFNTATLIFSASDNEWVLFAAQ